MAAWSNPRAAPSRANMTKLKCASRAPEPQRVWPPESLPRSADHHDHNTDGYQQEADDTYRSRNRRAAGGSGGKVEGHGWTVRAALGGSGSTAARAQRAHAPAQRQVLATAGSRQAAPARRGYGRPSRVCRGTRGSRRFEEKR